MDSDDRHYYCCGECQGLFKTLSGLSKHKKLCTGAKDLSQVDQFYAYHCSYLKKLFECCTSCKHNETCPLLTTKSDESLVKTRNRKAHWKRRPLDIVTKKIESGSNSEQNARLPSAKRRRIGEDTNHDDEPTKKDNNSSQLSNKKDKQSVSRVLLPEVSRASLDIEQSINTGTTGDDSSYNMKGYDDILDKPSVVELSATASHQSADEKTNSDKQQDITVTSPGKKSMLLKETEDGVEMREDKNTQCYEDFHSESIKKFKVTTTGEDNSQPSYRCPVCSWKTVHEGFFVRHLNTHKDPETKSSWQCRRCKFKCPSPSELKLHVKEMHVAKSDGDKLEQTKPVDDLDNPTSESIERYQVTVSADGENTKTYYKCTVCGWKTLHVGFFVRHLRTHNGTDPNSKWTCSECDFKCVTTSELKLHTKKHRKTFMCEYCSRRFATKQELSRHVHLHTGEKPYKCSQCDYKCRQPKNLIEHQRKHTGEKLKCEVEGCTFTTFYNWALKAHFGCKHVAAKRFSCPDCTYKTSDSGSMARHKRLHAGEKNYKCSQCNFRAVAKHDIVKHMRTHTKEKVYFCDQCNFGTSHSSCLRLHIMNHLGIKPWQCVLCGYNSITRGKVIRHLKQTHQGHIPMSINEAVVNLGLKLDINVSEYRRAKGTDEKVIYDVQEVPDFENLEEVELIVHQVDSQEKLMQLTGDEKTVHQISHIPGINLQQLVNNSHEDNTSIRSEAKTYIIPITNSEEGVGTDSVTLKAIGEGQVQSSNVSVVSHQDDAPQFAPDSVVLVQDESINFISKPFDSHTNNAEIGNPLETTNIGVIEEVVERTESHTVLNGQPEIVITDPSQPLPDSHETVIYAGDMFLDGQEVEVVWHLNSDEA